MSSQCPDVQIWKGDVGRPTLSKIPTPVRPSVQNDSCSLVVVIDKRRDYVVAFYVRILIEKANCEIVCSRVKRRDDRLLCVVVKK